MKKRTEVEITWMMVLMVLVLIAASILKSFDSTETYVELRGNPASGCEWQYSLTDNEVISMDENVAYMKVEGIEGAASVFQYRIHSLKPGNSVIQFDYVRPWDGEKVIERRKYKVKVFNNGKIKLTRF